MTKEPTIYNGERIISSYMVLGKWDNHMQKKKKKNERKKSAPILYNSQKLTQKGLKTHTLEMKI